MTVEGVAASQKENPGCGWLYWYLLKTLGLLEEQKSARFVEYVNTKGWRQALDGKVPSRMMEQVVAYSDAEMQEVRGRGLAGEVVRAPATLMMVLVTEGRSVAELCSRGEGGTDERKGRLGRIRKMLEDHGNKGENLDAITQGKPPFNARIGLRTEGEWPVGTAMVMTLRVVNGGENKKIAIPIDGNFMMLGMVVGE